MKTKKHFRSVLSVLLAVVMLCTVMAPMTAMAQITVDSTKMGDDMYLTSKTDYTVAPGITESHITTNNGAGNNQNASYVLEVDLNNASTSIIASYKDYDGSKLGFQKVRDQAYAAEAALNTNVVAGINADFFNMQTGATQGALVMGGTVYKAASGRPYFGITASGKAVIGTGELSSDIVEAVGGLCLLVDNGEVTSEILTNGYGTYTAPRAAVGIKPDGSVLLYVADGRQAPYSVGQYFSELAYTLAALGCETALCLDGGGSATFVSQHEGEEELVCRNSPSDGVERTVSSALLVCSSAKPSGEFHHASLSPNNQAYTPNSTVTFTAKGVDSSGYAAELPADGTFALADESYGTIDGATGVFTSNGKTGTVTVNYMSDGEVCGNVSIDIRIPDELYVTSTEQAVGPGVTTDFGIVAKYMDREVILNENDISWTITDATTGADLNGVAGTFSGLSFTGAEDDAYNAVVSATLNCETSISITLTVFIGSKQSVLYGFEYTTDADEAEADESLEYISSYTLPTYGSKWLSANGTNNATVSAQLHEQNMPLYMWPNGALDINDSVTATVVSADSGEPVRFGSHSLRIAFDYSSFNGSSNANFYLRATTPEYAFEGSPTAIGVWVYAPEGTTGGKIYLNCANEVGRDTGTSYQELASLNWTGWKYFEMDLTDTGTGSYVGGQYAPYGFYQGCGVFWISYQKASMANATADTIYIDDVTLIYGANTSDTTNPVVNYMGDLTNSIVDGETVYNTNTVSLKASYADTEDKYMTGIDDAATKMYIDGVDVTSNCYINEGDDEIYFYDAYLANGVHCLEVEVADGFGNKTTEKRFFTVKGEDSNTEFEFVEVDGAPVLGEKYSMAVVTNNLDDIKTVEIEVKAISNFTKYWDSFEVAAADGFELVGEPVFNEILSTIKFTVTKSEVAAAAESVENAVAYVNVNIPTDVPEGLEVTYRLTKGIATYTSQKTDKYVTGFSGEIITTCISPFNVDIDTMIVGSTGGYMTVTDTNGNIVEGVNIYSGETLLGVTDENGQIFTDAFINEIVKFTVYAEKDGQISFEYTTQSYNAGGDETGAPSNVLLNAVEDAKTSQSISWMASPLTSGDDVIVKYATKADYEAKGEDAFVTFNAESYVSEINASGNIATNYAVRFNSAVITGLEENTEYVYIVGDGTNMSEVKTFKTAKGNADTSFFVMGDTQSADTSNVEAIFNQLATFDTEFDFGIQTGDAVDNAGNYTYWDGIGSVFSGDFIGETDVVHVLGNHEYTGDDAAISAGKYFVLPGTTDEAPLCYSVQYGNVYVAVINYSNASAYAEAAQWIIDDANASDATWKVLAMHQPAYFTNVAGNSTAMTEVITAAVDAADFDFVFSGHDHSYARTYPITAGVQDENGAVYYICAATSAEKGYQVTSDPAIHEIATNDYNAIYLTVNTTDTTFEVTTWNYDGENHVVFDTYRATKAITCTEEGLHDYDHADGILTCNVCGYTTTKDGYTGWVSDAETGKRMYLIGGNIQTGWFSMGDDHYYFDENGLPMTGEITIGKYTYTFGDDYKMSRGALVKESGYWHYYINGVKQRGWYNIDGYWYYFNRTSGRYEALTGTRTTDGMTYTFDSNGRLIKGAWFKNELGTAYYWGPNPVTGLHEIDGIYYYFSTENTYMLTNESVEVDGIFYSFGADGKFIHYGEHVDSDENGECDTCVSRSSFIQFMNKLTKFFTKVRNFFIKLFS